MPADYIVQRADGAIAMKLELTAATWQHSWDLTPVSYSDAWLRWATREGARRYANMNGGAARHIDEIVR